MNEHKDVFRAGDPLNKIFNLKLVLMFMVSLVLSTLIMGLM